MISLEELPLRARLLQVSGLSKEQAIREVVRLTWHFNSVGVDFRRRAYTIVRQLDPSLLPPLAPPTREEQIDELYDRLRDATDPDEAKALLAELRLLQAEEAEELKATFARRSHLDASTDELLERIEQFTDGE